MTPLPDTAVLRLQDLTGGYATPAPALRTPLLLHFLPPGVFAHDLGFFSALGEIGRCHG